MGRHRKTLGAEKYETIIYWSADDKAFIAEVPELPGCAADGKTPAAALKAAQRIVKEWIETAKKLGNQSRSRAGV